MLIVDAQIHLWNAGNPTNTTHRQVPAYLKDDALKDMDAGTGLEAGKERRGVPSYVLESTILCGRGSWGRTRSLGRR